MQRIATITFGFICILVSPFLSILPVPVGFPLFIFGVYLVLKNSRQSGILLRRIRRKSHKLNNAISFIERKGPSSFSETIVRTKPRQVLSSKSSK